MSSYRELNPNLTAEQKALKEGVHQFAKVVLRPASIALDRLETPQQVIDRDSPLWGALRAAYGQGFHTALIPRQFGGLGLQGLDLHIALEEFGWGSSEFAASIAVAGFPFSLAAGSGRHELIDALVKPLIADKDAKHV